MQLKSMSLGDKGKGCEGCGGGGKEGGGGRRSVMSNGRTGIDKISLLVL